MRKGTVDAKAITFASLELVRPILMRATYSGDQVDGLREGQGRLVFANGDVYEGGFMKGFRHGRGLFTSERGSREYDGDWRRSAKHGLGKERWIKSGDRYEGEYENDAFHGKGKLVKGASGSKYDGEFRNGRKHGFGRMEFLHPSTSAATDLKTILSVTKANSSSAVYEGSWKDGRMHGDGKYTRSDGSFYQGTWVNGLCHGVGKEMSMQTGEIFEGTWHSGMRHGEGTVTHHGKRRKGLWDMGKRVKWTTAEMPMK